MRMTVGVPLIWQVTLPLVVVVVIIKPAGRSGLAPLVSIAQLSASLPVLVKTMAGLSAVPATAVTGVAMFASSGAVMTVIVTVAEDGPPELVAVMV